MNTGSPVLLIGGCALLVVLLISGAAPAASRADLAAAFLRFEQAYRANPPAEERLAEVNRAFDRATFAFFRGGLGEVARQMDALAATLRPPASNTPARRRAESLGVRVEPRVVVRADAARVALRVSSLYASDAPGMRAVLVSRAPDGLAWRFPLDVPSGGIDLRRSLPAGALRVLPAGSYDLFLALPDGQEVAVGRWFLVEWSPDEAREENDRSLAAIQPETPALADARSVLRERNVFLRSTPGESTRDLLLDPVTLAREIRTGIAALEAGRDPLANRPGHLWRTLRVGNVRVPMRLYVPAAIRENRPLPVVVALHGAGADENIFPEAYGAGEIVRQADKHGFVLVSPATGPFMVSRRSLGLLLDVLKLHLPVDEKRVYVVGHSMGAMSAVALAQSAADRLAAVAAIAGGGRVRSGRAMAPTLFVAGEIDPIVPAAHVRASYDVALAAGYPVEFRLARSYGHTLIVGDRLPGIVEWLLARRPSEKGR